METEKPRLSISMTIKRKLSNGELTSDYDNFIFSTVTDEFGEYSTSLLKLFLKVEGNDQSAVLNMLSNYLKLSVRSQGKIDGQIEELLKTEQYSAQDRWSNRRTAKNRAVLGARRIKERIGKRLILDFPDNKK